MNSSTNEITSKRRIEELTEEINELKSQGGSQKQRKCPKGSITTSTFNENIDFDVNLLKQAIKDNNKESFKMFLRQSKIKNPVFESGETALHFAANKGQVDVNC